MYTEEVDINDAEIASTVWRGCNQLYFRSLLDAIKAEAGRHGYHFGKKERADPMPHFLEQRITEAFVYRRISYLHPLMSDAELLEDAEENIRTGYAKTWLFEIIKSLDALGIRLYKDPYGSFLSEHTTTPLHLYRFTASQNIDIKEEELKNEDKSLDADIPIKPSLTNQSKLNNHKSKILLVTIFSSVVLLLMILNMSKESNMDTSRALSEISIDRDAAVGTAYTPTDICSEGAIRISKGLSPVSASSVSASNEQCNSDDFCLTSKTKKPNELLTKIAATIPIEKDKEYRVKISIEDITPLPLN